MRWESSVGRARQLSRSPGGAIGSCANDSPESARVETQRSKHTRTRRDCCFPRTWRKRAGAGLAAPSTLSLAVNKLVLDILHNEVNNTLTDFNL